MGYDEEAIWCDYALSSAYARCSVSGGSSRFAHVHGVNIAKEGMHTQICVHTDLYACMGSRLHLPRPHFLSKIY